MATKLGLYRSAVLLIKQNAIGLATTDDDAFVNTLDLVYDSALRFALAAGDWNQATRTVSIEASEDVERRRSLMIHSDRSSQRAAHVARCARTCRNPWLAMGGRLRQHRGRRLRGPLE